MKHILTYITFAFLTIPFMMSCSCDSKSTGQILPMDDNIITFHGICKDDKDGTVGLQNPSRGFRLEVAVDVDKDKDDPLSGLKDISKTYSSDNVTLAQSYMYLTHLVGKKLTSVHFETMQRYFDELERQGMKAVLRFAYERTTDGPLFNGPDLNQAIQQLDELKPFLEKNKDLILVVQAGVVGVWGEWHHSEHGLESDQFAMTAILEKLLEVVPKELCVQVRVPRFKNFLKDKPNLYKRISFHDDFIFITPHAWDGNMHEGTPYFNQIVKESPYLPVDGELPWGKNGWIIDGQEVARRLFMQHYTSLSIVHNYKEGNGDYSMKRWKRTSISQKFLSSNHMPFSDNYFKDQAGNTVDRTIFDYIRDHLGYRFELQQLKVDGEWKRGHEIQLDLSLKNRGFSSLHANHQVTFVLMASDGKVYEFPTEIDPRSWQPYQPDDRKCETLLHHITGKFSLSQNLPAGTYQLGLWLPDSGKDLMYNPKYAIRCANRDSRWTLSLDRRYGINVLTEVTII